jgi:hypothetical protein
MWRRAVLCAREFHARFFIEHVNVARPRLRSFTLILCTKNDPFP